GHIGGGILLAGLLGGIPAFLSIAAVLIIQCLFFADGGLLALGCNIFNMGVIGCLIVYPLVFKPLIRKGMTSTRLALASITAVVVSLQLGAFGVVLQTHLSGIAELPLATFALVMQPIHLAIGIAEGVITAAVLAFVARMRPELLEGTLDVTAAKSTGYTRKVLIGIAAATLLIAGVLSVFASTNPDGLEWAIAKVWGKTELETNGTFNQGTIAVQELTTIMPEYDFPDADAASGLGTPIAGIIGAIFTFALAAVAALIISAAKNKRRASATLTPAV
ncbi:MAG: energy-coupling factor ABC transporter permease, partial [Propionibacteriaceae bacterium]|nr:energy-coupling factor ABC transporter permease [Propionibacteriaceae bacterium]